LSVLSLSENQLWGKKHAAAVLNANSSTYHGRTSSFAKALLISKGKSGHPCVPEITGEIAGAGASLEERMVRVSVTLLEK